MSHPNIVGVTSIYGANSIVAGVATAGAIESNKSVGVSTVVTNAASSGKVLKINTLSVTSIGTTTGCTLNIYNTASTHISGTTTVSIGATVTIPINSVVSLIDKNNSIYLDEDQQLGAIAESDKGSLDLICSYEEIN